MAADILEFWPEYGQGPLWSDGKPAALMELGLPDSLVQRLRAWNALYQEHRLPIDGAGDPAYLAAGTALMQEVRVALEGRYEVVTTEPWWEAPDP